MSHNIWRNGVPPKSSILKGFSIINHPFGVPPFMETPISHICLEKPKSHNHKPLKDHHYRHVFSIGNILSSSAGFDCRILMT